MINTKEKFYEFRSFCSLNFHGVCKFENIHSKRECGCEESCPRVIKNVLEFKAISEKLFNEWWDSFGLSDCHEKKIAKLAWMANAKMTEKN